MYDIRQMQEAQLDIFNQVYEVCKKNNIPVFLAYGTAIGAVRHGGFIPWDDDIDIFIFQEDRERLKAACKKELPEKYFYQSVDTDKNYRLAIDRIRNSETTLIEAEEKGRDINHGIYIDIYPLFKCAEGKVDFFKQRISRLLYRLFLYNEPPKNRGGIMSVGAKVLLTLTPGFIKKAMLEKSCAYTEKKGSDKLLCVFYGDDENVKYERKWFEVAREIGFEESTAPIPSGNDNILKLQYGNYMQLPPEDKRVIHHDYVCVDCTKSYKEYMKMGD